MTRWWILTATLPTQPSGLRVRVWRALKATGAAALREGVYVLPEHAPSARALVELERTISEAGAAAHWLVVDARDAAQEQTFRALFDRGELYAELMLSIKAARAALRTDTEPQCRQRLRALDREFQTIEASDFFPGAARERANEALVALRRDVERRFSPGEPAGSARLVPRLNRSDFQGRTWATRQRPWVDRLATAWLVQRFVDRTPTFVWLAHPRKCPRAAVGYDFDGATFSHVGDKVTFEVVAESFDLLGEPALRRLATLVHSIDVGGVVVDEAAGLELVIRGLQARHSDDDALLRAALDVFDAAYAALQAAE